MLLKQINFIQGNVRIEIKGDYIERFINICAMNNVAFWDVRRISDNVIRANVKISGFRELRYYAKRAMCKIHIIKKSGLPFFMRKFRKRYALVAGFASCSAFLWILCGCIWTVDIKGCENLTPADVMQVLQKHGFYIGMKANDVDSDSLRRSILTDTKEILWITINVKGSHSEVYVTERSEAPPIIALDEPCNLIARKDGIIISMFIKDGIANAKAGSTVIQNDLLVSGIHDSNLTGRRTIHSMGEVIARTWYNLKSILPESQGEKVYTENQTTHYSLIIGNKRINLFLNSSNPYEKCDRIVSKKSLFAGDDIKLPICIVKENILEYKISQNTAYEEQAEDILKSSLEKRLDQIIGDGKVVTAKFSLVKENGCYIGTLSAECIENIAMESPLNLAE